MLIKVQSWVGESTEYNPDVSVFRRKIPPFANHEPSDLDTTPHRTAEPVSIHAVETVTRRREGGQGGRAGREEAVGVRSEEHTSELQSR